MVTFGVVNSITNHDKNDEDDDVPPTERLMFASGEGSISFRNALKNPTNIAVLDTESKYRDNIIYDNINKKLTLKNLEIEDDFNTDDYRDFNIEGEDEITIIFDNVVSQIPCNVLLRPFLEGETNKVNLDLTGMNISSIGNSAFANCNSLAFVTIPQGCSIGEHAFVYCNSLTSVTIPQGCSIGNGAFANCNSLTTINIPQGCSIGNGAFAYCDSLTTINIPQGCSIGEVAFAYCHSLTTINISQGCSIGNGAFAYCNSLTTINIPQGCSIGNDAFGGCNSLTTINISQGCSIGNDAFAYCNSLTTVFIENKTYVSYDFGNSLKYIITTSKTMSYMINREVITDTNDIFSGKFPSKKDNIYRIFELESRNIKSIDDITIRPDVIATPECIKTYLYDSTILNSYSQSTLYTFTLKTVDEESINTTTPNITIDNGSTVKPIYRVYLNYINLINNSHEWDDITTKYHSLQSGMESESLLGLNIPYNNQKNKWNGAITVNNQTFNINQNNIILTFDGNKIKTIKITDSHIDQNYNNYIIIKYYRSS